MWNEEATLTSKNVLMAGETFGYLLYHGSLTTPGASAY